jgi:hypothetical protein
MMKKVKMVGCTGIEPVTPCVSSKCSTPELTTLVSHLYLIAMHSFGKGFIIEIICWLKKPSKKPHLCNTAFLKYFMS